VTLERGLCRFCGLALFRDDAERAVHHEAPVCPSFAKLIASVTTGRIGVRTGLAMLVGGELVPLSPGPSEKS
jgi:hypothetical protein